MPYDPFPSDTHVSARSQAGYASASGLTLKVCDTGEWWLMWPGKDERLVRGPDLPSLQLWLGRIHDQFKHDARKASNPEVWA